METLIKLQWWNSNDLFGVLYQNGFKQHAYFYAFFDRDIIDEFPEVITDGFGEETRISNRTQIRKRLEVFGLTDSMTAALKMMCDHDNIRLTVMNTSVTYTITNVEIEAEPLGNAYNKGILTFKDATEIKAGCSDNMTTC